MQRWRVVIHLVVFPAIAEIALPVIEHGETITNEDAESTRGLAVVLVNLW